MHSTVIVGRMGRDSIPEVSKIFGEFDATASPRLPGLRRRQLFTYYDVYVHVQDFVGKNAAEAIEKVSGAPWSVQLEGDLSPYITAYDQVISGSLSEASASRFYHWEGKPMENEEGLHSTVIVNRVDPVVIPQVAELFGGLDATDFPHRMGTRRRQLFTYNGIYFHIQDFERENGSELIAQAWKKADPRFIQICTNLDPLVKKYDPTRWRSTADQIATRFYHWEGPA